ncbi:MAG: cytochrome c oxidase cbb3-type subunit [Gaiellaceae bacterium]|nr:cytochrome c oxidase cbb3-type subunit [Gaiellaceae bacterium]
MTDPEAPAESAPPAGTVARRRDRAPRIPIGLRAAPSDDELETNILERWQGLGVVLTMFLALFLPGYWLFFERQRGTHAAILQRTESIERGDHIFHAPPPGPAHGFQANCAQCHGVNAQGGVRKNFLPPGSKPDAKPIDWVVPSLNTVFIRQMVDQKKSAKDAYNFVYETISKGRPGTPMPTWGLGYGGPMNDQQIEDVINYLISIQPQDQLPKGLVKASGAHQGSVSRLLAFASDQSDEGVAQ